MTWILNLLPVAILKRVGRSNGEQRPISAKREARNARRKTVELAQTLPILPIPHVHIAVSPPRCKGAIAIAKSQ